jgi:carbonic anhydrase
MCDAGQGIDRRTALIGAGCLALGALMPGAAAAQGARRRQSPIDFRPFRITRLERLPRPAFDYPDSIDVTLVNTGSPDELASVRAELRPGAAGLSMAGRSWDLVQFHWHTPSEHTVEGRHRALEMHLVHTNADGGFLVLAVFVRRGRSNRALAPLFRNLPQRPDGQRRVPDVRLPQLLPELRPSIRYSGSLTTPPYTERVRWVVFTDPIEASRRQIASFRRLFPEGNSRETQHLNGREVVTDTP